MPVIPYRTTFNFIIFVTNGHIKQYLENKEYHAEKGVIFIKQGTITATVELSDDIEGFFWPMKIISFLNRNCQNIRAAFSL
jgi:hypothetical protein